MPATKLREPNEAATSQATNDALREWTLLTDALRHDETLLVRADLPAIKARWEKLVLVHDDAAHRVVIEDLEGLMNEQRARRANASAQEYGPQKSRAEIPMSVRSDPSTNFVAVMLLCMAGGMLLGASVGGRFGAVVGALLGALLPVGRRLFSQHARNDAHRPA